MDLIIFIFIFAVSIFALTKGADLFLWGAEKLGIVFGLSPFVVGVTIVSLGTSFPELFTGIVAAVSGLTEIVVANAVGSNIANILLVVGLSAIVGKKLTVTKNLIDLDLPLLAAGTAIMLFVIYPFGGPETAVSVTRIGSLVLIVSYLIYFIYLIKERGESKEEKKIIPGRKERRELIMKEEKKEKLGFKDIMLLFVGIFFLSAGANYLIYSVINISEILGVGVGAISIVAIALGTSLPELFVSVGAAMKGKPEIALGNIFGSNIFNSFIVIGIPGLIRTLSVDEKTFYIGLPVMALATVLFVISGISRRIYSYEGAFFILLYILFILRILELL